MPNVRHSQDPPPAPHQIPLSTGHLCVSHNPVCVITRVITVSRHPGRLQYCHPGAEIMQMHRQSDNPDNPL